MSAGLPIFALCPPLADRQARRAVDVIGPALDRIAPQHGPCLVVAPAGVATASSEEEALTQAEQVRLIARRAGVALIFGIDVGPAQPGSAWLFACFGGAPILWPSVGRRLFPADHAQRLLRLGSGVVLPLLAAEALDPMATRLLSKVEKLELLVVLSHGGATARWKGALARLERRSPVVVSAHQGGAGRSYASPSLGVSFYNVGTELRKAA